MFKKLKSWKVQVPSACLLCNLEDETRSHLFFNYFYSRSLLIPLAEHLNLAFWKIMIIPVPTQSSPDIRLGDLTEAAQKITHHSPPWGLLWNAIGCLSEHIWTERNKRYRQHVRRPPEVVLKEVIKDISLSFDSEYYKKSCCHPLGTSMIEVWETNLLRQRI